MNINTGHSFATARSDIELQMLKFRVDVEGTARVRLKTKRYRVHGDINMRFRWTHNDAQKAFRIRPNYQDTALQLYAM